MSDKLLTIAIPTYNAGENLIRAVKSCHNIKLPKDSYEILVVDNCSTDDSIVMLESLKQDFPNLVIYRNEKNIGRVPNWNMCIQLACGKYIIFLFTNDEIIENNEIHRKIEIAENFNAVAVFCPYFFGNELIDSFILFSNFMNPIPYEFVVLESFSDLVLQQLNHFSYILSPIHRNIYNLDVIKRLGLRFKSEYSEINCDQLFIIELILLSERVEEFKGRIILHGKPHLAWNYSKKRFHSNMLFKDVIRDDIRLLSMLSEYYGFKIDKHMASFYILYRIIREKSLKGSSVFEKINALRLWLKYISGEKKISLLSKYPVYAFNVLIRKLFKMRFLPQHKIIKVRSNS